MYLDPQVSILIHCPLCQLSVKITAETEPALEIAEVLENYLTDPRTENPLCPNCQTPLEITEQSPTSQNG